MRLGIYFFFIINTHTHQFACSLDTQSTRDIMYSKTLLAIASAALIGNVAAAEDATIVKSNPKGVTYSGTLPEKPFFKGADLKGNVVGSISATAPESGPGTKFTVQFSNFPKEGGPFSMLSCRSHIPRCLY